MKTIMFLGTAAAKTMVAAALALAMGTGMALAQAGGVGPPTPITPFITWETEGAAGKPLTPMSELIRKAHNGEGLNSAPTPRGFAQQPPAQGAPAQN
jgi:hypothetical protein